MLQEKLIRDAESGNLRGVQQLLAEGVDPDATDIHGITALMAASLWSWPAVAKCLVENGADIEAKEPFFGCTALTFACLSGTSEVLALLLESGASMHAADRTGRTPLMAASSVGNVEAVRLLLKFGKSLLAQDEFGITAPKSTAISGHTEVTARLPLRLPGTRRVHTSARQPGKSHHLDLSGTEMSPSL